MSFPLCVQIDLPICICYRYKTHDKNKPNLENLSWDFGNNLRNNLRNKLTQLREKKYELDGTLADLIITGLSIKDIKNITIQICNSLEYLSKNGITYFCLEPKNIGYKNNPKGGYFIILLNFESSKMTSDILTVDFQLDKSPQKNPIT